MGGWELLTMCGYPQSRVPRFCCSAYVIEYLNPPTSHTKKKPYFCCLRPNFIINTLLNKANNESFYIKNSNTPMKKLMAF